MSSNVSDDMTVDVTCPSCKKEFVINTTEIGEMAICPHCSTVMIAQTKEEDGGIFRSGQDPSSPRS